MTPHPFLRSSRRSGFTLIELLLVIAIIAILAAIVIIAINPARQLAQANNAQRRSNVTTILNAVGQYAIDNRGQLPAAITIVSAEICKTGAADCTNGVDLSALTNNELYVGSIPIDPSVASAATGTGYFIFRTSTTSSRITVNAPNAENGETITITR